VVIVKIGSIVAVLLLAAGLFGVMRAPRVTIDPGPLAEGHARIQEDCFSCHTPFLGPSDEKCQTCHKFAENREKRPRLLMFHRNLTETRCLDCHTDHLGEEAAMATREFDHAVLTKTTQGLCYQCHAKPPGLTHHGVKFECQSCHGKEAWKPAPDKHANCSACH
jgi:predicted CXXCH cytochrome family protein